MAKLIIKWLKIYSGKNITSVPCGQIASTANSIIDALYLSCWYDICLGSREYGNVIPSLLV